MAHVFLPLVVIFAVSSTGAPRLPNVDLNAKAKDPISLAKAYPGMILIAAPQDDDPHGDDPHDERHDKPFDKKLPARDHRDDHKAPEDPYGGEYPNDKKPY